MEVQLDNEVIKSMTHTLDISSNIKQLEDNANSLEAYVTTYNNEDLVGDIIVPGALDKFISEFKGKLPMLLNHNNASLPIGEWSSFVSDTYGVKGYGELYTETQLGKDTHTIIKKGLYDSVSIGFRASDFEMRDEGGIIFKEIGLTEVSIVHYPANPKGCDNRH